MINQNYWNYCLPLGLILSFTFTTNTSTLAQVTPDQTLGTQVTNNGSFYFIEGGTTVSNTNLFHSFSSFSIPNGGAGIFLNDASISNIFARVTGGTASDIQGFIRTQGTANLFLINPNGIIFGENALLDIRGSFVATTANAIQFPGGAEFSLTSPVTPQNNLLSVNPTAFLFNQIANQGANSIENRGILAVPTNKSLILLGGRVSPTPESTGQILIDGGFVAARDGRVEIGGLTAPGTVGLNIDNNKFSLTFPDGIPKTDISLVNNSAAFSFGTSTSNIVVNANNLNLLNSSSIYSSIPRNQGTTETKAGDVFINADGIIRLENESSIASIGIGTGNTGNVNISAQSLELINGSSINSTTTKGNAGGVNIKVEDTISLINSQIISQAFSAELTSSSEVVSSQPRTDGSSNGINIQARNVLLSDRALITSSNILAGKPGDIKIEASDSIILNDTAIISSITDGKENAGNVSIIANRLIINNAFSNISASTFGSGDAGNIDIKVKELRMDNTSFISSNALNSQTNGSVGNGGDISIEAERVFLKNGGFIAAQSGGEGQGKVGRGGNITITASDSIEIDGTETNVFATGFLTSSKGNDAGNITINTKFLQFRGADISAATLGEGNGGNVIINSTDGVVIDDSVITSEIREGAVGKAGDIEINTPKFTLTNGGQIIADISEPDGNLPGGQGEGGNVRINASDAVIISGLDADGFPSLISVTSDNGSIGKPGNITINTSYFRLAERAEISASTSNFSDGGNITINARTFEALNGGRILNSTSSSGNAGDININAKDSITISGISADGYNAAIFAGTNADSIGNGGTISLFTNNFNVANGAGVTVRSEGQGIAGNINIIATGNYTANNSFISARAEQAGGGNINIAAKNISLRNNSDIRTDLSTGQANGGNINLNANTIIALEDSDILAFAPEGQGGNITFNTRALLTAPLYSPAQTATDRNTLESLANSDRTDINASGAISGNIIGVPDITFIQNSLTELQDNPIDTNRLIANSCIARSSKQKGTFLITGVGGLPTRPNNAAASNYSTGDVENISNNNSTNRQWKKGDRIIEPQGVYRLANGNLVMSRECR
ncbi:MULTISPECIES: filamentous hemagglutinin N-terminal domain-containing protein [Nostoc]|uniref:S-layer family protein n=1 Tax=Nostoc paludosum FACHB-159 TaxID=2692908 RepID=A0ABR8K3F7_9NOSO|nr:MULTISPECIES: filamentous hemagglutinin N-terminal domain-containing protein [Nostoc]MBD2677115.1 S-layer family protein [Nostoc sp. FACHB-857]MBD2733314.1 S-layer family protein [Nostoc paludosum FACHB-159]